MESARRERIAAAISKAFNKPGTLGIRLDRALDDARLKYQRVLIVFADPQSKACQQLYGLYYEDTDAQKAFADYQLLSVNAKDAKADEMTAMLKARLGAEQISRERPTLLIVDVDGKLLATSDVRRVSKAGQIDRELLIDFLRSFSSEKPDAEKMLADALVQADREGKCVLLQETGAFCGWCVVLSRFIEAHRDLFARDYVPITIDRHRFGHGQQVMDRVRTSKDGGIPWMAILDSQGKVLVTSDGPKGNIGYPAKPEEIEHFMKMLTTTARRLTPEQLATLRKDLEAAEAAKAAGESPAPAAKD